MPSATNIRHADMERVTLALLLLLTFNREKPGCYPELDLEGFLEALDQALVILERSNPGTASRIKLDKPDRETFIQGILEHYSNVVSIGKWRGQLLIRFKAQSGQNIRKILGYIQLDQAWKIEIEHACEGGLRIYRGLVNPPDTG
ncbi:hypothetical protein KW800_02655 [Candidatus Parcubacteria bacterium]|nr:hypothetical protein [Candidatus Parcubacteria bacterium]